MVHEGPKPLERWVKRLQDLPESIKVRHEQYLRMLESDAWRAVQEQLLPGRLIKLDASLSPQRVLASAKQGLAFETYPILHPPRILQGDVYMGAPEDAPPLKALDDLLKIFDEETGEEKLLCGTRSLSAWGPFCPVALAPPVGLEWKEVASAPEVGAGAGQEIDNPQLASALQVRSLVNSVWENRENTH